MVTDAQKRAIKKYEDENIVRISVKLNKNTDADILDALAKSGNKQGLIKDSIRAYIGKK